MANSFFFIFSPLLSLALVRHRRKEKRFGPSPANDYTSGHGGRKRFNFFGLGRKGTAGAGVGQDPNALPQHATPDDVRGSYATEQTRVDGGYGGLGDGGAAKYESPYGNDIQMGSYPNASTRYENNGGVIDREASETRGRW